MLIVAEEDVITTDFTSTVPPVLVNVTAYVAVHA